MHCRHLEIHGVPVRIQSTDDRFLRWLPQYLPCGSKASAPVASSRVYSLSAKSPGCCEVHRDAELLVRTDCVENALHALEYDLEQLMVSHSPTRLFLHAGVVGWNDRLILVPGSSFSGKSTLTAALCQAGGVYYSDEFAPIDANGCVHAYPRPIHLRQAIPGAPPPPRSNPIQPPRRVGLVLLTQYRSGARWAPSRTTPGQALLEILGHTFPSHHRATTMLAWLARCLEPARIYQGCRGDVGEVIRFIQARRSDSGAI